jgi:flagellar M-ring protein FliF
MESGKRKRLIVLVSLIFVVVIAVSILLNQKTYTVLYSGMERADTAQVLSLLSGMGVDAKAQGEDTVLVAGNDVDTVRMELAGQGYPASGLNYDIYKGASGLGVTDSEKKVYYQFQQQENLRKTISQMSKVEDAVVNLDLGEDSSYVLSNNNKEATASIMLTLAKGVDTLSDSEVGAIRGLVTKSISGLKPENVQIVDSNMKLYTDGEKNDVDNADTQLALQNSVKAQYQQQIKDLLSPVFGEDNILAEVNVTLDFDKTKSESIEYAAPEGREDGLVTSMKELVEAIKNDGTGGITGIDANGNASQYLASLPSSENAVYYDVSREVNYEINQTTTQIEQAQGQVKDLSISVILNSENTGSYDDEVKQLVSTATGAKPESITVEALPFAEVDTSKPSDAETAANAQQQMMSEVQSGETTRLIILVIGGIIVAIFLFSILKMLIPKKEQQVMEEESEGFELIADEEIVPEPEAAMDLDREIDFEVKDDNLSVLKDYVNKNPESVANMLRNWLNED